jgi:glycine/D-amino acid oxidase-like deaminating enzyme
MPQRIVICGGGAIGTAIAYFLARRGAQPIVVERNAVGGAASGKSGGFLAYDWCRGQAVDKLAQRSFQLHAELAHELGNPWGYRRLDTFAGYASEGVEVNAPPGRPWLSQAVTLTGRIGTPDTTALVEPHAFTNGLMRAAETNGAELKQGAVVGIERGADGAVRGVRVESGETIEGDAVVIAMGPWSILATRWLKLPPVYGLKGHSLVFRTGDALPAEALFLEYQEESGEVLTPEVFARADGTVWACAVSSTSPLPIDPAEVRADEGAHDRLERLCRSLSPAIATAPIVAKQACFRPVTEDGVPLIGAVPGVAGAYVATGHSVDLARFSPRR